MIRFEDRLRATLVSVMGLALVGAGVVGCGPGGGPGDPKLEGMCEGDPAPDDYYLYTGFVTISPGTECPDAADAQLEVNGCTFYEWEEITCGFEEVKRDQVYIDDGYGGHYVDAGNTPTGYTAGPVVDVCFYEGVFYQDPNHPTCGRPLLRDGEMVTASVHTGTSGWLSGELPVTGDLTPDDRSAVAAYWLECAVMEHASVASFSHFSLDLMRPPGRFGRDRARAPVLRAGQRVPR